MYPLIEYQAQTYLFLGLKKSTDGYHWTLAITQKRLMLRPTRRTVRHGFVRLNQANV